MDITQCSVAIAGGMLCHIAITDAAQYRIFIAEYSGIKIASTDLMILLNNTSQASRGIIMSYSLPIKEFIASFARSILPYKPASFL